MAKKKSKNPSSILLELPEEFDNAQAAQAAGSYMDGYVPEEGDWDLPNTRSGETMEQMAAEDAEKPYPPNPYAIRTEVPEDVPETVSEQEPPVVEPAPESEYVPIEETEQYKAQKQMEGYSPDHGRGTGEPKNTDLIKTMGDYSDRPQNYSLFQDLMTPKESPYSYGGAEFAREMEKTREAALADRPEVAAALGADLQDLVTPATSLADKRGSAEASEFQENRKNKQALVSDVLSTANNLDQSANSNLLAGRDVDRENAVNKQDVQNDLLKLDTATKDFFNRGYREDDKGNLYYKGTDGKLHLAEPNTKRYDEIAPLRDNIVSIKNSLQMNQTKVSNTDRQAKALYGLSEKQGQKADSLMSMLGVHTATRDYSGLTGQGSLGYSLQNSVPNVPVNQDDSLNDSLNASIEGPKGQTDTGTGKPGRATGPTLPPKKAAPNDWDVLLYAGATPVTLGQLATQNEDAATWNSYSTDKKKQSISDALNNVEKYIGTYNTLESLKYAAMNLNKIAASSGGLVSPEDLAKLKKAVWNRFVSIASNKMFKKGDAATLNDLITFFRSNGISVDANNATNFLQKYGGNFQWKK